jgi:nicotinate-nucleotide adenylyltransferase
MNRIGIFGGTFDPPHKAHIAIAEQAKKQFLLNGVIFVPAYIPPHKLLKTSTNASQRLAMVKLAIGRKAGYKVSALELRRGGISFTIDTLRAFHKRFPRTEIVLILGADNLSQFRYWKAPDEILKLANLAIYRRKGFDKALKNTHITFEIVEGRLLQISSTELRRRIQHELPVSQYISKQVLAYIKKHSLYRTHMLK